MSGTTLQRALLEQQVEFLQAELREAKRKEDNLKQLNESLIEAMHNEDTPFLKDQTIQELQKSSEQYLKDLESSKERFRTSTEELGKELQNLTITNKELGLELKHLKLHAESGHKTLHLTIKQLESENHRLDSLISSTQREKDHELSVHNFKLQVKTKEFREKLAECTAKHCAELDCSHKQSDTAISELKSIFNKENENLRQQLRTLQTKLKEQQSLLDGETQDNSFNDPPCEANTLSHLHTRLAEKERLLELRNREIKDLHLQLETVILQKDRAQVELDRFTLELKQHELDNSGQRGDGSILKRDIKLLVGKLLRAKDKIAHEVPHPAISPLNISSIGCEASPYEIFELI